MKHNQYSHPDQRYLCERRDKEFLEMYHATLDAMNAQGVPHAHQAAVQFTIDNGHPHYHVDFERAYRCVCHLLKDSEKAASNARTYRIDDGVPQTPLRQQMWQEITDRVRCLLQQGMSVQRAVEHVLEHCRASRFFISTSTALTKICTRERTRQRAMR